MVDTHTDVTEQQKNIEQSKNLNDRSHRIIITEKYYASSDFFFFVQCDVYF